MCCQISIRAGWASARMTRGSVSNSGFPGLPAAAGDGSPCSPLISERITSKEPLHNPPAAPRGRSGPDTAKPASVRDRENPSAERQRASLAPQKLLDGLVVLVGRVADGLRAPPLGGDQLERRLEAAADDRLHQRDGRAGVLGELGPALPRPR